MRELITAYLWGKKTATKVPAYVCPLLWYIRWQSFEDRASSDQSSENTAWPLHRKRTHKQGFTPLPNLL